MSASLDADISYFTILFPFTLFDKSVPVHLTQKECAKAIYSFGLKLGFIAQDPKTAVNRPFA